MVPEQRVGRARHVSTVHPLQPDAAAVPALGEVAADGVFGDGHVARAERNRPGDRRLAGDEDAAAVSGAGLLEALVEEDTVVVDGAVLAVAEVADAAAVGLAEVAADPVVVDLVVVASGEDRQARASAAGQAGSFDGAVLRDLVVMDLDAHVEPESSDLPGGGPCRQRLELEARDTDADAAVEGAGVAVDAVVGDMEVVRPAVDVDAAAGVATRDADAVDARVGAEEVAVGDRAAVSADRSTRAHVRAGHDVGDVLGKHRDARALFRAEHSGLEDDDAAGDLLRRQLADLRRELLGARDRVDAEQRVDARPPDLELGGRVLGRVDDDRPGADALQPHRLPHDHQLVVGAGVDQDEIARRRCIDRQLDGAGSGSAGDGLTGVAAGHAPGRRGLDVDGDGVNRLLAGGGGDLELLSAQGAGGDSARDLQVAPGDVGERNGADGHGPGRTAEAVVANDGGHAGGRPAARERPAVGRVRHVLVAQGGDRQRLSRGGDPRTGTVAVDPADGRSGGRRRAGQGAVDRVVAGSEGRERQERRVEVRRLARHVRVRVAEVAVRRIVLRVGDQPRAGRIGRIGDRTGVVDAGDQHAGPVARRSGRVH